MKEWLEPTVRKGCTLGVGGESHRVHGERQCDACYEGTQKRKRKYVQDNFEIIKAKKHDYRESNKEAIKSYTSEYQQKNAEKIRIRKSEYQKANPELIVEISQRRRAKTSLAPNDGHTIQDILELYGTDCHVCGEAADLSAPRSTQRKGWQRGLHVDHLIPLSRGGTNLLGNVRPSHALCNLLKHVDIIDA